MEKIYKPEKAHQRYILKDGSEVKGASTIAKVDDDFGRLINWANKQGLKGINANKKRDQTADAGSVAHYMIQCHFQRRVPNFKKVSQEAIELGEKVFHKFMDWWIENELSWIASELELVSELYRYGGTIDLVAKDYRDRVWVIDVKTSSGIYWSHKTQLAGLGQLWNEHDAEKAFRHVIIRLSREDDEIEPYILPNVEKVFACFLAQLNYTETKYAAGGYK